MLVNLTPHPIRIYPPDCPDRVSIGRPDGVHDVQPLAVINPEPNGPARISEHKHGTMDHITATDEPVAPLIPVEMIGYAGLVDPLPEPVEGTWYIVSLLVAIYVGPKRTDLLVPSREVRSVSGGQVIGYRQLALPVF